MSATGKVKLAKIQQETALRVTSAYCTVSADAALVVASMLLIDFLAIERLNMYHNKINPESRWKAREATLRSWQTRLGESFKGRWTHRFIPSIDQWMHRRHGDVDFHLTQFLTGHGCYPAYLHKLRKLDSLACLYWGHAEDDANHTIFECDVWKTRRCRVNTQRKWHPTISSQ